MSKAKRVSDVSLSLPEDIVAEIMSWLPVESLLRFKCVCKNWYQLIQQDDFVEKHHRRAAMRFYCHQKYINQPSPREDAKFSCIDIQKGLMLEHERRKGPTERFRIRNPATRQTVYLPDLRVGNEPPTWVVAKMFFVGNECTVISFSESEKSVLSGQFRALTVGIDATWRPLKNSPPNSIHRISNSLKPQIYALSIEMIFHVVNDKKILWIDAEDESIKTTKIPENLFSDGCYVTPIEWKSKLALFCDDGYEINIWVLINNNKNEWAKTHTIHLANFTQDYPILYITEEEKTWIWGIKGERREVNWCRWHMEEELSIKPTILQLKGMQSENVEETKGIQFWKEIDIPRPALKLFL